MKRAFRARMRRIIDRYFDTVSEEQLQIDLQRWESAAQYGECDLIEWEDIPTTTNRGATMTRQDLPRCKTCKRFDDLELNADPEIPEDWGECMLTGRWEEPDYGCVWHSDYDEPETQTEINDDSKRND